jgi:hydrogenase/urease accessory protein HupE
MKRLLLGLLLLASLPAWAHENLPASLLLTQTAPQVFTASWRVPALRGASALALQPLFGDACTDVTSQVPRRVASGLLSEYQVQCDEGLEDLTIAFPGLESGMLNVLVSIQYADGQRLSRVATPREPRVVLRREAKEVLAVSGYFLIGIEHILGGLDHLLFVFCLVLLVTNRWALIKTISAFTLAHSLTLAAATLGYVQLASMPVEASIALSILFLARELVRPQTEGGQLRPWWLVAFAFGLLHGLGFAGALSEVGLPEAQIPMALLLFNLGVEAGQLLFVAVLLALRQALRHLLGSGWQRLRALPSYAVGALAGFWFVQRMVLLLA